MRERVTVVTLSVCQSVCHFSILEKAPFSGLKLPSVYILGDDLSPLNQGFIQDFQFGGGRCCAWVNWDERVLFPSRPEMVLKALWFHFADK